MIETERLILRQWRDEDYPIFAQLNADPEVMRYFPELMSREESDAQAGRISRHIANKGWGFWAVELKSSGEFIGFIGLHKQQEESGIPHAPLIEAGWRLQAQHWGNGYATEGAKRAIRYAFEQLDAPAVYAYTPLQHRASQRVMIKAGMTNTGDDFNYPKIPAGHALERFCLYRITR
ncbi:GNAT family N-acetyltransferase [Candidatus Symbiopectobacterium sp. NZEC127]|uniref:GNAT family N-acetyltransferase n=1 Tax=Candidatus Symbiopectobacterium sp. NZEC127 TaxID=2820472 RepID=UPI0022275C50|nr:GNAT family N-acetyltransferase [Candidatus Symbiopectobacterium sp. NZEC127]MCW2486329.1 GNAT family N-acetyltransferase [Candidatus Symbiopectobacterium sp. NZEC127]